MFFQLLVLMKEIIFISDREVSHWLDMMCVSEGCLHCLYNENLFCISSIDSSKRLMCIGVVIDIQKDKI